MAAAMRGDIASVANMSFDCIMCGLCAARCPAEEPQYNIAILSRRLYGRYLAPRSEHLAKRVDEIKDGKYSEEITALKPLDKDALMKKYKARPIEA
jgi:succinate dehydrogenase/fumarate reductase-like Fe-S protein